MVLWKKTVLNVKYGALWVINVKCGALWDLFKSVSAVGFSGKAVFFGESVSFHSHLLVATSLISPRLLYCHCNNFHQ